MCVWRGEEALMVPQVRGDVEGQEKRMEVLSPGNTKNNKF